MAGPKTQTKPALVTADEAAAILGVSRWALYRIVRSDPSFPAVHLGRSVRVHADRLDAWLLAGGTARVVD